MGTGRTSGRRRSATGNYISNSANDDDDDNRKSTSKYQSRRRDASSPSLSNSEMSEGNRPASQSQSHDGDGTNSKSKSASPSPHNENGDVGNIDDSLKQFGDLWPENDIFILMKLVYKHKSLEVKKLFPEGLSVPPPSGADDHYSRSIAETKVLLERLAEANTITSAPSGGAGSSSNPMPTKNDPGELLAILASERAFMRRERIEGSMMLDKYKKIKGDVESVVSATKRHRNMAQRADEQYAKETAASKQAFEEKRTADKEYAKAQEELSKTRDEHTTYIQDLNTGRLNALETRRKLDKIRLKIAATRGEMVVKPTMVEDEEYQAFIGMQGEKNGNDDEGNDNDDDGNNDEAEKMDDLDKYADADTDVNMQVDDKEVSNDVKEDKDSDEINDVNAEKKAKEKNDNNSDCEDIDIGFDEDGLATEIRLLKNRLNMYDTEVADWEHSLEAMKMQKVQLEKANVMLAMELKRLHSARHGNGYGGYTGARRRAGSAATPGNPGIENHNSSSEANAGRSEAGGNEGNEKKRKMVEEDGQEEKDGERARKSRRKGIPTRRMEACEGVKVA